MRNRKGFTLIEVLVVVSILGVLMGLVSMLVIKARSHRKTNDAKQLIGTYLPNFIERYKDEFHRWPPMTMKGLHLANKNWNKLAVVQNTTNECGEVLLVALRHPDFTAKLQESDVPGANPFGNTDDDIFNTTPYGSDTEKAMEILDPWGSPVVYIDKNHYGTPVQIINGKGDEVEVNAVKKPNGTYYNASKFQIISIGRDGKQEEEPGGGDDIMNFTPKDE